MIEINKFPTNPGIYIMKNKQDKIIYIGKAKNLKNRISSYFNNPNSSLKTYQLVKNIESIDTIICNSELEALILENNMIKKHKPKYNILLKDNKTYPYLKITNEKFPKLSIVKSRKHLIRNNSAYFFGPYPMSSKTILKTLTSVFGLNRLSIDMYNKKVIGSNLRNDNINELYFENPEDEKRYLDNIKDMLNFLNNRDMSIKDKLYKEMVEYADNLEFEKAIVIKKRIELLNKLVEKQFIESLKDIDEDIFVYKEYNEKVFICILSMREGKIVDKNVFNIDNNFEDVDVLQRLIISYYDEKKIPKNIVIEKKFNSDIEILEKWFKEEKGIKVNISAPFLKSRKLSLLEMGLKNLEEYIKNYYNTEKSLKKGLLDLKKILNLKKYPRLIECFDISNIQGKDAVSAMSVTLEGKAANKRYRHFKINSKDTPDDFTMMRETISRRYSKIDIDELPDLILIDGGKGQLSAAVEVLKELGKFDYVDVISIAKREEEIFKAENPYPFIIDKNDEALKILIRTRDEVHRFGITYHRKLRSKRNLKSILDDMKGIGPKRKKELIKRFGSVKNVLDASYEELSEILPIKVVEQIKEI